MKQTSFWSIITLLALFISCEYNDIDNISQPINSHHITQEQALTQLDIVFDVVKVRTIHCISINTVDISLGHQ